MMSERETEKEDLAQATRAVGVSMRTLPLDRGSIVVFETTIDGGPDEDEEFTEALRVALKDRDFNEDDVHFLVYGRSVPGPYSLPVTAPMAVESALYNLVAAVASAPEEAVAAFVEKMDEGGRSMVDLNPFLNAAALRGMLDKNLIVEMK
jgi:hypothetical protein